MEWVLPNVLSVDDVNHLPDEVLYELPNISTGIVLKHVNKFVEDNVTSATPANQSAAIKLQQVYDRLNKIEGYLNSKDARDFANTLASLQYSDINYSQDLETLKEYRNKIIDFLSEDKDFVSSYSGDIKESETKGMKSSYTAKMDKDNLASTLNKLTVLARTSSEAVRINGLINRIKTHASLFKNGNYNLNAPTVMRRVEYKKDKLLNLLKGLDFIIPKMEAGKNAREWRRF